MEDMSDLDMRYVTVKWIQSEQTVTFALLQEQKDLTDDERAELTARYKELDMRRRREERELRELGEID